jgi:hypothetical protein
MHFDGAETGQRWLPRLLVSALAVCRLTAGQDATVAGELTSPYPTLTNLALEWKIAGDDNLNGIVDVRYRRAGENRWRRAMPLRRVPAGKNSDSKPPRSWPNKHSGSIFDLEPGTEYEIAVKLSDPDGGSTERSFLVRTRPEPRAAPNARIRRVTPANLERIAATAKPGDILLLAPGQYGSFKSSRDGEPRKPIVFRSAIVGAAIFDGFSLRDRRYVHLEAVKVNGSVDLLGGEELVVRGCIIEADYGIIAKQPPGAKNSYIADNVLRGKMPWDSLHMGHLAADGKPANMGEGIEITGPGNVICHNSLRGYRDAISFMEDRHCGEQVSIDVYNNDIQLALDDAIEADFSMGNCRIMRNRITNCFVGVSSQPGLGGPTYFIRNVMYNLITAPFKLMRNSLGDVLFHNTVVKVGNGFAADGGPWSHALFRNNLCIGGKGGGVFGWRYSTGPGLAISLPGPHADADYDGAGAIGMPFQGRLNDVRFEGVRQMRDLTTEKNGVQVDMGVFARDVEFPDPPIPERPVPDLRLKSGSAAVDRGVVLLNITDGFSGTAPDLGAYELGAAVPVYGPRPRTPR